jgi:hypothetical protein
MFGTPARACGFLIGNVLWFGSILVLLLGMPDDQRNGGASPGWLWLLVPIVMGIVLMERSIMAMSRSSGGSSWNVGFSTRIRAMSPQTYRAAANESALPLCP